MVHPSVAEAVPCHHERWDGARYPNGLKRTDIPLYARIIFVADVYDVMTTGRSYRAAMSIAQTGDLLDRQAGSQFGPQIVNAFGSIDRSLLKPGNGPTTTP